MWTFLLQINAVKFILWQMQRKDALNASGSAVTAAIPNHGVTYVGCSFVNEATSNRSASQSPAERTLSQEELQARAASPRAMYWYYKSGKKGNGDREIRIEDDWSTKLEDGWKSGKTNLKFQEDKCHWDYDFVNMIQTWYEPGQESQSKPVYRKVGTGSMQWWHTNACTTFLVQFWRKKKVVVAWHLKYDVMAFLKESVWSVCIVIEQSKQPMIGCLIKQHQRSCVLIIFLCRLTGKCFTKTGVFVSIWRYVAIERACMLARISTEEKDTLRSLTKNELNEWFNCMNITIAGLNWLAEKQIYACSCN